MPLVSKEVIADIAFIFAIVFPIWMWLLVLMPMAIEDGDGRWWQMYRTVSDKTNRILMRLVTGLTVVFATFAISLAVLMM